MEYNYSNKMRSLKPSAIREIFKSLSDPTIISFAAGNPSPLSFPSEALAEISADIFKNDAVTALQYSVTEGYPPFRRAIAERLKLKFNIGREFDTTIITSGGQQGIELACKALCNEGDSVICCNPSFIGALNSFRSNGVTTIGVDIDDDGINIEKLELAIKKNPNAKLLYLIPTFQNPTGITMSLEKRRAVYAIAKKYSIPMIEDNPYGELRFSGEPVPTIKSMDEDGLVIYCSSFSKILSAGMRIGYISAPDAIVQKMVVAKQSEDVHTNIFFQILCYRYMTERDMDSHIDGICKLYGEKCTLMLSELEKNLPAEFKFTRPEGGLFIWVSIPENLNMSEYVRLMIEKKLAVVPGNAFNCDVDAISHAVRINYSMPDDEQIIKGAQIMGEVARDMLT